MVVNQSKLLLYFDFRFHKDSVNGMAPYFVFGDFNFRCDTEGVVKVRRCLLDFCGQSIQRNSKHCFKLAIGSS